MSKGIITKYMGNCIICGNPTIEIHHGISGTANRQKSDEIGLIMPLCPKHHNSSKMSVHQNREMQILSKQLAELAFEKEYYRKQLVKDDSDPAKEEFRKIFGQCFI